MTIIMTVIMTMTMTMAQNRDWYNEYMYICIYDYDCAYKDNCVAGAVSIDTHTVSIWG